MAMGSDPPAGAVGELGLCLSVVHEDTTPEGRSHTELSSLPVLRISALAVVPGHRAAFGFFVARSFQPDHENGLPVGNRSGFDFPLVTFESSARAGARNRHRRI